MENSTIHFIHVIPEILDCVTLLVCFAFILGAVNFLGKSGLYAYSLSATIAANIQVLKLTQYSYIADPVALGTVLFSTTFAVDNILTEYYGVNAAKKGVYISFFCYLFFVIVMQIAVFHPHISVSDYMNLDAELAAIFSPSISIFVASLLAYFVGQRTDIFVYSNLKKLSLRSSKNSIFGSKSLSANSQKHLAFRSMISMAISAFVDNCVFSFLAWIVFAKNPISLSQLWNTYIFVTYFIRLTIAALCVPLVHLAGRFIAKNPVGNQKNV